MFELKTRGSDGAAKCFVDYSAGSPLKVSIDDTFSDFSVTHEVSIVGNALIVNININPQG